MNRAVFASLTILCLLSISSITGSIQVVKADDGTIYIRADGSISPSTALIYSADNTTYTLTGNVTSDADGIVVERDNIILDGAGYTVTGSGSPYGTKGATLTNRSNVTVRNLTVTSFYYGIYLYSSSNNILSGNNVMSGNAGIYLYSSSNNTLSGNNVTAIMQGGIGLISSSNNTLSGNNVTANKEDGIGLTSSSNNSFSGNVMAGNGYNFDVDGSALSDFLQSVDTSNVADGKPVYYIVNQSDIVVNTDAYPEVGYLGLVNCANVTVQGMSLTNNGQGLLLAFTNDSKITDNNIANNYFGVWLHYSSGNTLTGNNVTANNYCGVVLRYSSNNFILHDSFVNNTYQVCLIDAANTWDDGYPSGGNYWSDYNGTDANHDGIGDTPYIIDANNTDHYPLVVPYVIPEFPSFQATMLFMLITLLAVIIYKKKGIKTTQS